MKWIRFFDFSFLTNMFSNLGVTSLFNFVLWYFYYYCSCFLLFYDAGFSAEAYHVHKLNDDRITIEWLQTLHLLGTRQAQFNFSTPNTRNPWNHSCYCESVRDVCLDTTVVSESATKNKQTSRWKVSISDASFKEHSYLLIRCEVHEYGGLTRSETSKWTFSTTTTGLGTDNPLLILTIVLPVVCLILGIVITSFVYQRILAKKRQRGGLRNRQDTAETVISVNDSSVSPVSHHTLDDNSTVRSSWYGFSSSHTPSETEARSVYSSQPNIAGRNRNQFEQEDRIYEEVVGIVSR